MASVASLVAGIYENGWSIGWIDGVSIIVAILIIVSVTAGNNYIKEKQFQKLVTKAAEDYVACFRGGYGNTETISTDTLVVGDVIKIESGMRLPADIILLEGTDISCDESGLTGEPEQMEKSSVTPQNVEFNPNPFLLSKTLVVTGQGLGLVACVGPNTLSGMAEEKLNIEEEATPLQQKLETIANEIGKLGVYVSILTFLAMTINDVITVLNSDADGWGTIISDVLDNLIVAITIIVVAVPEGLPLAVTIALAFSVMKMKDEQNLVRKLHSSETMGGANEICTDKTGTLTQN